MTLNSLLESLSAAPAFAALIFRTDQGDIGAGYHITELKHARITSIDCGARRSEWDQTSIQILDGNGRAHMEVGKFVHILQQSLSKLNELGDAPTQVEFAPGNTGLRTYHIEDPELHHDRVVIRMKEVNAVCKPSALFAGLRKQKPLAKAEARKPARSRECCT